MHTTSLHAKITAAAGSYLVLPFALAAGPVTDDPGQMLPAADIPPKIVTLTSRDVNVTQDGKASFIIDLSKLAWSELWDVKMSDQSRIILNPDKKDSKDCPFFDLSKRKYEVQETARFIYKVEAPVSATEKRLIDQKGCITIKTISESDIKTLQPN